MLFSPWTTRWTCCRSATSQHQVKLVPTEVTFSVSVFLNLSHEESAPVLQPCWGRASTHLQLLSRLWRQQRHLCAELLLWLTDRAAKRSNSSVRYECVTPTPKRTVSSILSSYGSHLQSSVTVNIHEVQPWHVWLYFKEMKHISVWL